MAATVRNKSKSPPSRRQLFKETFSLIGASGFNVNPSTSSAEQAFSEATETSSVTSSSDQSCESISSQVAEEDAAVPSTSSDPVPSTSAAETQLARSKRRRKKLKSVGRHMCSVCSKMFGSPGKLNQHTFAHTGEKPFECEKCRKAFSSKFKLVRHLLIHSDERQYRCPMCDRTFHRKDHLKNHLKVHSPVKKTFRCDKAGCLKVYSSLLSYRKHAAVHAAEDGDLECKMCGKNFVTKEEIVYHLKVHAGSRTVKNPSDKKYGCDYCDRRFFTRKDVRRHLVVHTGKRDFLCQFCPHRFGRKDHLVRHIKKSHCNVTVGVNRAGAPKGKRLRLVSNLESSQANISPTGLSSTRQRTVLRTHGRPKDFAPSISQDESSGIVFQESSEQDYVSEAMADVDCDRFSTDLKATKQEFSDVTMKVEDTLNTGDEPSFHVDHVKVEDCIIPDLQPIIFSQAPSHPSFTVENMTVPSDQVDSAIKSEQPLSSLTVGIDMNQFITGYLVPSTEAAAESDEIQNDQPVSEQPVAVEPPPSTGMSDAEATEFLAHFSNDDEIMQLMELSIPITPAQSSTSTVDLNSPASSLAPLPRFQQAFQQQPP